MSISYANSGSGPSAGGIGWINFENLTLTPGGSPTTISGSLLDGTTITFDISLSAQSITNFSAVTSPTYLGAAFGVLEYTDINGNVILYSSSFENSTNNTIIIDNIIVEDNNNNPVSDYTIVVADAENTSTYEKWIFTTDNGPWQLFNTIGGTPPALSGIGTQTATITGVKYGFTAAYLLTTASPTNITLTATSADPDLVKQAIAIGFAINRTIVRKNIGERIDSNDQFVLDISSVNSNSVTTTGTANGIQAEFASVYGFPNTLYTVNESMSPTSVSSLSQYNTIVSATNVSVGGIAPPIGVLPQSFTPDLGDIIVYDILNAAPQTFEKKVDKAYSDLGETLTYTVTINNPNDFAISNVSFNDPQPAGTSFIDIVSVIGAPYIGTNPAIGLTFPTIGANTTVEIVWRALITNTLPMFNSISNVGTVEIPGGTSGSTNVVTTNIKHADLLSNGNFLKSVNPVYADLQDVLTYTLILKNTGNTAANNVVVTDSIPAGTTYVPGSVTSSASFTGTPLTEIALTAPIAAGQTVTINFDVKVDNTIPKDNPIPNQAKINYSYTVDPANPNGVIVEGYSNIADTLVSNAKLVINKSTDKSLAYVGDKITYNIAVTNTGNVSANGVIINDPIPNGTVYVPGSLTIDVAFSGNPLTTINLSNPIMPGETVAISFQVQVVTTPNPNPINNVATANYSYTVDPQNPNGVKSSSKSNNVLTLIFKYNFSQQITDLVQSIALEEAALAAIANAEGKKIQTMVAMDAITPEELLCLNKSVSDMMDSIAVLNAILKQKLNIVNCQIDPPCI